MFKNLVGLAVVACIAAFQADAATVNVTWSGTVFNVDERISNVSVGSEISGEYSFELESDVVFTKNGKFANYQTMHDSSFAIGDLSGTVENNIIQVQQNKKGYFRHFLSTTVKAKPKTYTGDLLGGCAVKKLNVRFGRFTGKEKSEFAIPTILGTDNFLANRNSVIATKGCGRLNFAVETFTYDYVTDTQLAAVPTPAALPMLASGLALFGFAARRKKS